MSESEEEKEEQKETLKEKIDRLALESSENDEDFDVSDQVLYFCLTFDVRFFILDAIIHNRFKWGFTFTINLRIRRKLGDLTLLRQIARSGLDDTPLASYIFLVRCCTCMCFCTIGKIYLATFSLSSFQPAKCSFSDDASSNEDSDENSDDSNVSSSEVRDILEDALINKELHIKLKEQLELLLDAERNASAPASKQEFVEPVCGKVNTSKNDPLDDPYEE